MQTRLGIGLFERRTNRYLNGLAVVYTIEFYLLFHDSVKIKDS